MSDSVPSRWIFDETELKNTPSLRDNIGHTEEMTFRQSGTQLIKDMSDVLKLKPIVVNTAIVYFQRFFTLRSFKAFNYKQIAVSCLFLSAKFEGHPIAKEHIICVSLNCRQKSNEFMSECNKLIENENEMLLTFGFDLSVVHSQTVIINASECHSVINRTVCQNAYRIAGDLLRLTTICLQYRPAFIACVCLYLSSHLLNIPITTTHVSSNWCQLIGSDIKLEDVEEVAKKYKSLVKHGEEVPQVLRRHVKQELRSHMKQVVTQRSRTNVKKCPTNGVKRKMDFKKLNLKITFSTFDSSKSSMNRIVSK